MAGKTDLARTGLQTWLELGGSLHVSQAVHSAWQRKGLGLSAHIFGQIQQAMHLDMIRASEHMGINKHVGQSVQLHEILWDVLQHLQQCEESHISDTPSSASHDLQHDFSYLQSSQFTGQATGLAGFPRRSSADWEAPRAASAMTLICDQPVRIAEIPAFIVVHTG